MFVGMREPIKRKFQSDAIARGIAVPHDAVAQRLPSFPNLERTATIRTATMVQYTVPSAQSRTFLLLRSPVHPLWAQEDVTLVSSSAYLSATLTNTAVMAQGAQFNTQSLWNDFRINGSVDLTTPYRWPLGVRDNGDIFVYCPGTHVGGLFVEFTTVSACLTNLNVELQYFDGVDVRPQTVYLSDLGEDKTTHVFQIPYKYSEYVPSWVRLVSLDIQATNKAGATAITTINFGWTTGGSLTSPTGSSDVVSFFPISAIPEYENSKIPYQSTRQNASAVLLSNVSSYLNKEGTVSATRIPRTLTNTNLWDPRSLVSMPQFTSANPTERYYGKLEKGMYSYTLPDSSSEKFRDLTSDLGLNFNGDFYDQKVPLFPLEGFDYMNVILLSDLDDSGSTAVAITVDSHLEFRTNSALFTLDYCPYALEEYHKAQMALAQCGVFFENPTHLAAIARTVAAAAMKLGQAAAPYVKTAVRSLAPMALEYVANRIRTTGPKVPRPPPNPPRQRAVKAQSTPGAVTIRPRPKSRTRTKPTRNKPTRKA